MRPIARRPLGRWNRNARCTGSAGCEETRETGSEEMQCILVDSADLLNRCLFTIPLFSNALLHQTRGPCFVGGPHELSILISGYLTGWFLPDVALISLDMVSFFSTESSNMVSFTLFRLFRNLRLLRLVRMVGRAGVLKEHLQTFEIMEWASDTWSGRIKNFQRFAPDFRVRKLISHRIGC